MCTEDDKSSRISQFLIWKLSFSMSWKSQLIFHRCVDVMIWDKYSFLNVLSGVFVWEMLYVVFYDHMLWMNEVNKFTKKVLSLSLPSLFVRICRKTCLRSFRPGPTKTRLRSRWSLIVWLAVWTYWYATILFWLQILLMHDGPKSAQFSFMKIQTDHITFNTHGCQ